MREAPSLVIIPMLQDRGARIHACDPQGRTKAEALLPGVTWHASALEAVSGADVLVALTEWNEFRALDLRQAYEVMRGKVLVDLRNMYSRSAAEEAGLRYFGIGKKPPNHQHENREVESEVTQQAAF
jgi:UDPglucose 6-dehydrogenase